MLSRTIQGRTQAENLSCILLKNCGFSGYRFDTSFTLSFTRNIAEKYEGNDLPWAVEVQIPGEWWFDTKTEWNEILTRLMPHKCPQPEEPVQAYELTLLRWTEGTDIETVCFDGELLVVKFKNQRTISISSEPVEDYSWVIEAIEGDKKWSVVSEGGKFYSHIP